MRFKIIVKASEATEAAVMPTEDRQLFDWEDFVQGPAIEGIRAMGIGGEASS
jgi:hypothetical protein